MSERNLIDEVEVEQIDYDNLRNQLPRFEYIAKYYRVNPERIGPNLGYLGSMTHDLELVLHDDNLPLHLQFGIKNIFDILSEAGYTH